LKSFTHKDEAAAFRKVGLATLEGLVVGAACGIFPHLAPVILTLYNVYKVGKLGKKVVDAYNKEKRTKNKVGAAVKAGVVGVSGEVLGHLMTEGSDEEIKTFSTGISSAAVNSGIFDRTNIDKEAFQKIMENTITQGINGGVGGLIAYTIETAAGE
jgi:hypothetical protein